MEPLREKAPNLIFEFEGIDQPSDWPGGASGITIGIGYDLGYESSGDFANDWQAAPERGRLHDALPGGRHQRNGGAGEGVVAQDDQDQDLGRGAGLPRPLRAEVPEADAAGLPRCRRLAGRRAGRALLAGLQPRNVDGRRQPQGTGPPPRRGAGRRPPGDRRSAPSDEAAVGREGARRLAQAAGRRGGSRGELHFVARAQSAGGRAQGVVVATTRSAPRPLRPAPQANIAFRSEENTSEL